MFFCKFAECFKLLATQPFLLDPAHVQAVCINLYKIDRGYESAAPEVFAKHIDPTQREHVMIEADLAAQQVVDRKLQEELRSSGFGQDQGQGGRKRELDLEDDEDTAMEA